MSQYIKKVEEVIEKTKAHQKEIDETLVTVDPIFRKCSSFFKEKFGDSEIVMKAEGALESWERERVEAYKRAQQQADKSHISDVTDDKAKSDDKGKQESNDKPKSESDKGAESEDTRKEH